MTPEIEAARRIVEHKHHGQFDADLIMRDAETVALALLALVDAKDDLAELWEIAGRATEGPWRFDNDWWRIPSIHGPDGKDVASVPKTGHPQRNDCTPEQEANAAHIAAFNPTVAQRLIARVRAAEKQADPHEGEQVTQQQRGKS